MPTHFHTGQVHFFTMKGRWGYEEYPDDPQTEGSYLYEPPGTVHTLHIPEDVEVVEGFMVVNGVNVAFDDDGNYLSVDHAGSMEELILQTAREQGVPPTALYPPHRRSRLHGLIVSGHGAWHPGHTALLFRPPAFGARGSA